MQVSAIELMSFGKIKSTFPTLDVREVIGYLVRLFLEMITIARALIALENDK